MTQMTTSKKTLILIARICVLYVVLWIFIPPMQVGDIYRLLAVLSLAIWFFFEGQDYLLTTEKGKLYLIMMVITLGLRIFFSMPYYGIADAVVNSIQLAIIYSVGMISLCYMSRDKNFLLTMITIALIIMCIFNVTTIQSLIDNPYASRIANSEWLEERFEGNENVGLYGFVYMCVLIVPFLFNKIITRTKVNKFFDIVCVVSIILMTIMIAISGYMIAIFATVVGCVMVYLLKNRGSVKAYIFILIAVLAVLFYKEIVSFIFDTLMSITEGNPVYYNKFRDFKAFIIEGDTMGETTYGRFKNYGASFNEMLQYPIIGCMFFGKTLGGGHTFIVDTIGKFGWFVAIFQFIMIYAYPYKIYKRTYKNNIGIAFLICVIIVTFFDPIAQEMGIASMLFFPYFSWLSDKNMESKNNSITVNSVINEDKILI